MKILSLEDATLVSGGEGDDWTNNWTWDESVRSWGNDTIMQGLGVMAVGGGLIIADGPIPAGDLGGVPLLGLGGVWTSVGLGGYLVGTVGGVADWIFNPETAREEGGGT